MQIKILAVKQKSPNPFIQQRTGVIYQNYYIIIKNYFLLFIHSLDKLLSILII